MVDANIKKVTQSFSEMPPLSSITEGYDIRYRIISEDKNRLSHWSELSLVQPNYTFVPDEVQFSKANSIVSLAWDAVTINKVVDGETYFISKASQYDLWYRWDRGGSKIATITNISASAGTITYTATNTFSLGDIVTITGVVPNQYNLTNATIATASGSNFTIANASTGTFVSGGEAATESGDWLYKERIEGTTVATPIPSTWTIGGVVQGTAPNRLSVEIYLKGNPIARAGGPAGTPFLKVYRLLNQTV
jgi:hypothetical protein